MKTELQSELQQFKAQALVMADWADKMLAKIENPKKKKGLSEAEINKALTKRRKIKSTIKS